MCLTMEIECTFGFVVVVFFSSIATAAFHGDLKTLQQTMYLSRIQYRIHRTHEPKKK